MEMHVNAVRASRKELKQRVYSCCRLKILRGCRRVRESKLVIQKLSELVIQKLKG